MDRKLLDYLPPVLREVMEMQAINEANGPEIAIAWNTLNRVLNNQFLETADIQGVAMWEKELKISPKNTETLETRKAKIKAQWNLELPYSLPWLRNWLTNLCGPSGYEATVQDYTINVRLDYTKLPEPSSLAAEILKLLLTARPSNMQIVPSAVLKPKCAQALAGGSFTGSRREQRVAVPAPGLSRPGGGAHPWACAGVCHAYRRLEVSVRIPAVSILEGG